MSVLAFLMLEGHFFCGPLNLHVVLNIPSSSTRMQHLGPKLHPCAAAMAGRGPGLMLQASVKPQSQALVCTSSGPWLFQSLRHGNDGRLLPAASPMDPFWEWERWPRSQALLSLFA